jgi:hypothetical protein
VVGVAWTLVWSRCAPFHGEADEALARSQALALAKEGHDRIWTRGRYWLQRDSIWQDEGVAAPPMPEGWRPTRREPMVLGASAVTGLVVAAVASSPFWYASAWSSLVNVNARGYCYLDGTPLHEAAYRGTVVVANRLLARGAGINAKDGNGNTPLHNAVLYGRSDLVRVLLENRADVNAADKGGMTPLHRAACSGHVEVGRLLLDKGANMHAVREGGRTPLSDALECRHPEFAALLREHGATK